MYNSTRDLTLKRPDGEAEGKQRSPSCRRRRCVVVALQPKLPRPTDLELSPSLRTQLCSAIAHIIRTGVGRSRTPLTVCKFSIHSSVPIFNLASTFKGAYIHPSKAAAASLVDHRLRCRSLGLALLVPHRHAVYTVALYTWHHAPVHRQCCWMRSYVSFSPIFYRLSLFPAIS